MTRHEVLFWLDLILPDSARDLLPSSRVPLKFDGLAFPNTELHNLVSLFITFWWKQCSQFPGSSMIFWWVRRLCTYLLCEWPLHLVSQKLFGHNSGEVSNFCNSPSSRSESAVLSIDSSKCSWDFQVGTSSQQVTSLPSRDRVSFVPQFVQIPSFSSKNSSLLILFFKF